MSNINESGHARNIAQFSALVQKCAGLGPSYNPSRPELQLEGMRAGLENAAKKVAECHAAQSAHTLAVAGREKAFADFGTRITRIHSALKASASTDQVDEKADALVRTLRGARRSSSAPVSAPANGVVAALATGESAPTPRKGRSNSHASYDMKLDHLDRYLALLGGVPDYHPNEPELQLEALSRWRTELASSNAAVIQSGTALDTARAARNDALYATRSGLFDLAADSKTYVKSLYGSQSSEYRAVTAVQLVRRK